MDKELFIVTSVNKEDLKQLIQSNAFETDEEAKKAETIIKRLTPAEMRRIARMLENDYIENWFWNSLLSIFNKEFIQREESEEENACLCI